MTTASVSVFYLNQQTELGGWAAMTFQVLALFEEMDARQLLPNIVTHNVLICARVSSHWEAGPESSWVWTWK